MSCSAEYPSISIASHKYKMCNDCRSRYRTYGTTKRAKSKAEREAFDRVLLELRIKEDQRRQQAGEPVRFGLLPLDDKFSIEPPFKPLAESPEELRQWEFAILNGTELPSPASPSPTPSTSMTGQVHPHIEDASNSFGSLTNKPALTLLRPTNAPDSPHANSPYQIPRGGLRLLHSYARSSSVSEQMKPFQCACAQSRIAAKSSPPSIAINAASNTGCRIDITAI